MEIKTNCPFCGNELTVFIDVTSSDLPDETGTECACGAIPVWSVNCWVEAELVDFMYDERTPAPAGKEAA